MNAWHVADSDGGPPPTSYRYHTYLDCGNLQRIIRLQPERLRNGTGDLRECWNCAERQLRERRQRR